MQLEKLLVDKKETWVKYPGAEGFEVLVAALSRKEIKKMRDKCIRRRYDHKSRQAVESLDEDLFVTLFAKATIKDWKGLTLEILEEFLLIEHDQDPKAEVNFSDKNAETLISESTEFDNWLNEVINDLATFRGGSDDKAVSEA